MTQVHSTAQPLIQECKDRLMRLHGISPYNNATNLVQGDPIYANSIKAEFAADIIGQAEFELGLRKEVPTVQAEPVQEEVVQDVTEEPQYVNIETVKEWEQAKEQLAIWKAKEIALRKQIADAYFQNPKEGSNKKVDNLLGCEVSANYKMNRNVSKKAITEVQSKLDTYYAQEEQPSPEVFRVDGYAVNLRVYKALPDEVKVIADEAITSSYGTPTLEIKRIAEKV